MILLPDVPVDSLGKFFGIAMMIFGAVKLVGYFSKDLFRLAFQYDLEFGILMIALGVITLIRHGNRIDLICISLGICIFADSLFKVKIAWEAKNFGVKVWWLTLLVAVLTAIMGALLVFRPSESADALIRLLGSGLLTEGILGLSVAISLVKIVKNQMPDVIAEDSYMKEE
jgi:uncharacterized membrane protein HdeD (DUF308 family)